MASNLKLSLADFYMKMSESMTFQDITLPFCALSFIPVPRLVFGCSEISFFSVWMGVGKPEIEIVTFVSFSLTVLYHSGKL